MCKEEPRPTAVDDWGPDFQAIRYPDGLEIALDNTGPFPRAMQAKDFRGLGHWSQMLKPTCCGKCQYWVQTTAFCRRWNSPRAGSDPACDYGRCAAGCHEMTCKP